MKKSCEESGLNIPIWLYGWAWLLGLMNKIVYLSFGRAAEAALRRSRTGGGGKGVGGRGMGDGGVGRKESAKNSFLPPLPVRFLPPPPTHIFVPDISCQCLHKDFFGGGDASQLYKPPKDPDLDCQSRFCALFRQRFLRQNSQTLKQFSFPGRPYYSISPLALFKNFHRHLVCIYVGLCMRLCMQVINDDQMKSRFS